MITLGKIVLTSELYDTFEVFTADYSKDIAPIKRVEFSQSVHG